MKVKIQYLLFLTVFTLHISIANSQVTRTILVEHFTNTNCSICASRNPGFFTNLNAQSGFIYFSTFPSAPYASCKLSQQNKVDADARTNYYSVYGGTPRLAINGSVISNSADYSSSAIFNSHKGQTTAYSVRVDLKNANTDSFLAEIIVKKISADAPIGAKRLFAVLVEDTVFYAGTNGETKHYNVGRKSLFGASGMQIKLPINIGDSVVINQKIYIQAIWNKNRMIAIAAVQDSASKKLEQVGKSNLTVMQTMQTNSLHSTTDISIFPNPASGLLTVHGISGLNFAYKIYDVSGSLVSTANKTSNPTIQIQGLANGIYFLQIIQSDSQQKTIKFIVDNRQ